MPSIIQADQLKSADGNTTYLNSGTLSNVTFPSGHITRHFYDEKKPSSNQSVTTLGGLYNDLELEITNANTADYLFVNFFLPGFYNSGVSDRTMGVRVRFSIDNFVSPANGQQFGSNEVVFSRGIQIGSSTNFFGNISGSIRAQHPSASYKIRLFLIALNGNVDLFFNSSANELVANLSAFEIKA